MHFSYCIPCFCRTKLLLAPPHARFQHMDHFQLSVSRAWLAEKREPKMVDPRFQLRLAFPCFLTALDWLLGGIRNEALDLHCKDVLIKCARRPDVLDTHPSFHLKSISYDLELFSYPRNSPGSRWSTPRSLM